MKREDRALRIKIYFVLGFFGAMTLALMARAFQHQVVHRDRYLRWAKEQQLQPVKLVPQRGKILDARGTPLAVSLKAASLFAHPPRIQEPEKTAEALARHLNVDARGLKGKLRQRVSFVWLARQLPIESAEAVERLQLSGIGVEREGRRYYPFRQLAANVIGFAGVDSQGLEGVEWFFEKYLKGEQGTLLLQQDALGRPLWQEVHPGREHGVNEIVLTLDARLQFFVEEALREAVEANGAAGGNVVILEPQSGEILAMASWPTFNPNQFRAYPASSWRNRAITDSFEPGSTIKPFMLAAVLEKKLVNEETRFYCEKGKYLFGGHWINDIHPEETLTVREIIVKSSNIGTTKVAEVLGSPLLWKYLKAFGFGQKTGVDLPGEATGILRPWKSWTQICLANHAFGQGFSLTALQLATAYAVLANGGFFVEPHVVRAIRDEEGRIVEARQPRDRDRVISRETSERVLAVLESAVLVGTGKRAQVSGFRVGGKTGTAQKFEPRSGRYSPDKIVCSFVGIVPIERPQMVVVVVLDEPRGRVTGGMIAAPVFHEVASKALLYRNVQATVSEPEAAAPGLCFKPASGERTVPAAAGRLDDQGVWIMPELRSLTVRTALTELEGYPILVKLDGSGIIAEQNPLPGYPLESGQTVQLKASPSRQHGAG